MAVEHIESLEVINFKCFKHLIVSDIGKVNLIGGKNNVGKTAFLEAVELLVCSDKPEDLAYYTGKLIRKRQQIESEYELDFFFKNEKLKFDDEIKLISNIKTIELHYNNYRDDDTLYTEQLLMFVVSSDAIYKNTFTVNQVINSISSSSFNRKSNATNKFINYITSEKSDENKIAILLGQLIESRKEVFLSQSLQLFDTNILAIKQIPNSSGVTLKLELKNQENLVLLSSLGEGINRYIAILCAIWASKDGVLLIDEIENGIHYTNYKKLWEIIFKTSVEANCQLFITTHSKECIMAFNEAQFEYGNINASYIELYKNKKKDDLITAAVRDKEQLQYSLNNDGRIRGE